MELEPKTVLITGASKRLGRSIALDLARHGWNIGLHFNSSEKEARATEADARTSGVKVALLKADLSQERESAEWYSADRASWDKHMETNLRAPFVLSQQFARQVPRTGHGAIINLIDQR